MRIGNLRRMGLLVGSIFFFFFSVLFLFPCKLRTREQLKGGMIITWKGGV